MNRKLKIAAVGLGLLLVSMSACSLSSLPINGQVLEEGTGKPIPDAIVVVTWKGDWWQWVQSSTVCYHVETARTDAEGKYHIPAWSLPWEIEHLTVTGKETFYEAYKPGYTQPFNPGNKPKNILLARFKGTKEERLGYLMGSRGKECGSRDDYAPKLIPLYRALFEEAKSIAVTKQDMTVVNSLHYSIDDLELGSAAAAQNQDKGVYGR